MVDDDTLTVFFWTWMSLKWGDYIKHIFWALSLILLIVVAKSLQDYTERLWHSHSYIIPLFTWNKVIKLQILIKISTRKTFLLTQCWPHSNLPYMIHICGMHFLFSAFSYCNKNRKLGMTKDSYIVINALCAVCIWMQEMFFLRL